MKHNCRLKTCQTKKTMREFKKLKTDVGVVTQLPKCPYCGGRTVIRPASYVKSNRQNSTLCVCENYPSCDTYGRVSETKNGNILLISTPACKKLRLLRSEAHHYFDIIVNSGVFSEKDELYKLLSARITIGRGHKIHIGECGEYSCQEIIAECIKIIYANKEKIGKIKRWKYSNAETPELAAMLDEICK